MRIVTWNCNRQLGRKLGSLLDLSPDVAIIQECERNLAVPDAKARRTRMPCPERDVVVEPSGDCHRNSGMTGASETQVVVWTRHVWLAQANAMFSLFGSAGGELINHLRGLFVFPATSCRSRARVTASQGVAQLKAVSDPGREKEPGLCCSTRARVA